MAAKICTDIYLFREANSFEENCELFGTDNVRGQISVHIFAPNGGYCLYIPQFWLRDVTRWIISCPWNGVTYMPRLFRPNDCTSYLLKTALNYRWQCVLCLNSIAWNGESEPVSGTSEFVWIPASWSRHVLRPGSTAWLWDIRVRMACRDTTGHTVWQAHHATGTLRHVIVQELSPKFTRHISVASNIIQITEKSRWYYLIQLRFNTPWKQHVPYLFVWVLRWFKAISSSFQGFELHLTRLKCDV